MERAQAAFHASRDENQELRNRAEKVEHIIAEVAARTGDDGRDKMSPRSIATVGLSVSSSRSALESGTREILAGQWGLEAQGKGEVTGRI